MIFQTRLCKSLLTTSPCFWANRNASCSRIPHQRRILKDSSWHRLDRMLLWSSLLLLHGSLHTGGWQPTFFRLRIGLLKEQEGTIGPEHLCDLTINITRPATVAQQAQNSFLHSIIHFIFQICHIFPYTAPSPATPHSWFNPKAVMMLEILVRFLVFSLSIMLCSKESNIFPCCPVEQFLK